MLMVVLGVVAGIAPVGYLLSRPDQPRPTSVATHHAQVIRVKGATSVATGERCTIRVEPAEGEPHNCRIVVKCGAQILYGALKSNGYVHCALDGGVAISAHEAAPNDSDPDLHWDMATGQATVKDTGWQVDLKITAP